MYFDNVASTIAEIGAHGDHTLPDDEFLRDDRCKRIDSAARTLGDWVFEYLSEIEGGDALSDLGRFKLEHLPRIARMVAIGMMRQFEHDETFYSELIAGSKPR
jgi:hypothetical protein